MSSPADPSREGWPALVPVDRLHALLGDIFPPGTAHRGYVVREMAARVLFVMLYTGAVEGTDRWMRPAQVTLMTDAQAARTAASARMAWARDSLVSGRVKHTSQSWYATNTREPIRDETLRSGLVPLGAVVERTGIPTTSALPRYAIRRDFCALLLALADGSAVSPEIDRWRRGHLSAEALARVQLIKAGTIGTKTGDRLRIEFPNGETRLMLSGPSASLTKAVVEVFARRFLRQPAVLLISDSGEKVVARDEHLLAKIGLPLEADRHLPDVILLDGQHGAEKLVFVEIVASDGGITPLRQAALLQLARRAKFAAGSIHFVTAFADRDTAVFRRLAAQLAWGTFAWFASEPTHLLCYRGETEQLEATSTG